ncbi:hypothetical protein HELRODRAFT_97993 [Helobdella robusta]|uniref:SAM domain-containing protein n=1 Tax=Helobdella robusta TaxID=6412 RepID=T1G9J9_HELRO|nr:hypothetical protein HELRODRAFT_97993 [Helobdella robusta]ESO08524.1 hypothetical protein HELRODRAFT_97993 [Helobdella robusta]
MTSFSHNVSSKDSSVSIRRDNNNNNTDGYADKSNINNNESNNTINNNSVIINVDNDNDGDNFYPDNDDGTVIVKKENAVDESGDTVLLPTPSSSPSRVGDGEDEASSRRFHQQCRSSSIDIPVFPKILFSVGNQAPDASNWLVEDVYNYFIKAGYPKQAETFKNEEIDGRALLLLTRADVLTGMGFKLGPALKIHAHIQRLVDASSSSTSSSTF